MRFRRRPLCGYVFFWRVPRIHLRSTCIGLHGDSSCPLFEAFSFGDSESCCLPLPLAPFLTLEFF
jgi:hypothetical protein